MSAPITAKIKLRDIVYSYQESAKSNEAEFLRLWRIAFRGFKQMGLNAFWEPQTEELVINQNLTANFPVRCITWCKIGLANAQGELQTFAINRQLTTYRSNGPNRVADISTELYNALTGPYWFTGTGFYGQGFDGTYNPQPNFGAGSHLLQPSQFNVDEDARVVILPVNYPYPNLLMQFVGAPEQNLDYEIPMQFEEAMIKWLSVEDIVNLPSNSHFNNNNIVLRGKMFAAAVKAAKKAYRPFNLAEAEQYYRESFLYGVKG